MKACCIKLLEKLVYFASPAFKHSSAAEAAQAVLTVGKFQQVQVLLEADYQVLMHPFGEDQVHIL